jgi:hypothetical protein
VVEPVGLPFWVFFINYIYIYIYIYIYMNMEVLPNLEVVWIDLLGYQI